MTVLDYNDSEGKPLVDKFVRDGSGEFIVYLFNLENSMFSENKIMKMTLENGHVDKIYLFDDLGKLDDIFNFKSDTLFSNNKPSDSFRRYFSFANGKLVFDIEKLFLETQGDNFNFLGYKPTFEGGDRALMSFLMKNLKYPNDAIAEKASGKVYVQFEINEYGKLGNFNVVRGKFESLNKEALRVVSLLPDWTPGFQHNVPVPVTYVIPINFN